MFLNLLPIDPILEIVIFIVAGVILVGGITTAIIFLSILQKRNKMYHDIDTYLESYVKADAKNRSYERVNASEYDYILNTKTSVYYIMIIPNASLMEIVINSPTKWQYRRGPLDSSNKFIPRVDRLMRFDGTTEELKSVKRMYVLYPRCKSILRQINECELEFVRPNTDINGTIVVSYDELVKYQDSVGM